jgi:hypothetical protein
MWWPECPKEDFMPRWPNGGPKKLYVVVENKNGTIHAFDRREKKTAWLVKHYPRYTSEQITHLIYGQLD